MNNEKQNDQNRSLVPTEEQKAALLKTRAKHEQRMKTDPEYRAMWEERLRKLEKHSPLIGESME